MIWEFPTKSESESSFPKKLQRITSCYASFLVYRKSAFANTYVCIICVYVSVSPPTPYPQPPDKGGKEEVEGWSLSEVRLWL